MCLALLCFATTLTRQDAVVKFGAQNLKIYTSSFVNLWYGPFYEVSNCPNSAADIEGCLSDDEFAVLFFLSLFELTGRPRREAHYEV